MLLEHGYRWRVGKGASINIWGSPWLRCTINPYIPTIPSQNITNTKVNSLIDFTTGGWNIQLIHNLLEPRDAMEVLKIPLLQDDKQDSIIWRYDVVAIEFAWRSLLIGRISRLRVIGQLSGPWKHHQR